jgi:hypothetical protein
VGDDGRVGRFLKDEGGGRIRSVGECVLVNGSVKNNNSDSQ